MVAAEPGEPGGLGGCHPHCIQALRVRPWQSPANAPSWRSPEDREASQVGKPKRQIFSSKSGPRPPGAKSRKCLCGAGAGAQAARGWRSSCVAAGGGGVGLDLLWQHLV